MNTEYQKLISCLIKKCSTNMEVDIDVDMEVPKRRPTAANSMFLTNKEQGEWAEKIVLEAINRDSQEFCSIRYGHSSPLSADSPRFSEHYSSYIKELNTIGKRPDILIYKRADIPSHYDCRDEDFIRKAIAAIEVRSSSFLINKYSEFMEKRTLDAKEKIKKCQEKLKTEPYSGLLLEKSPEDHKMIQAATVDTFRDLKVGLKAQSSTRQLKELSKILAEMKEQIKILCKRDYLSITPKLEDFALVNRWIQRFGVKHYYLQVFFDKAYVISFKNILELICDPENKGTKFFVERDTKNQRKTTIKVKVRAGKEILGKIDMPEHHAKLKELDRGRLLYYVTFRGGKGCLDSDTFFREIVDAK